MATETLRLDSDSRSRSLPAFARRVKLDIGARQRLIHLEFLSANPSGFLQVALFHEQGTER